MTVEHKAEQNQAAEAVIPSEGDIKVMEETREVVVCVDATEGKKVDESKHNAVEKSASYREESNFLSDLKESERKALAELKSKLEEAILGNALFKKEEKKASEKSSSAKAEEKKKSEKVQAQKEVEAGNGSTEVEPEKGVESKGEGEDKGEKIDENTKEQGDEAVQTQQEGEEEKPNADVVVNVEVDKDIALWGVSLLPSKGDEGIDVVLLKFLRAREFKVNEAFEMLKKTLKWRRSFNIDSVFDEDFGADLAPASYISGTDHEGHPICYNIYGVFDDEEFYQKTLGTDEHRQKFLRWKFQCMEKGIQKLDLRPGGVTSLLQINDLKHAPGPSKKGLRVATKQAIGLLQDNYPELVAKNIFINVPFWSYAMHSVLSPFLTQRTKSKFVFARPGKVTETLLKYIPANEIPIQYGGFKRENDYEFSVEDGAVSELSIKAGSAISIVIPAAEAGATFIWDLTVLGWEVNYKEEFIPTDEGSYTIIVQKRKKMGSLETPVRNTFKTHEPGKIVLTIENGLGKKKKILYRHKIKKSAI